MLQQVLHTASRLHPLLLWSRYTSRECSFFIIFFATAAAKLIVSI